MSSSYAPEPSPAPTLAGVPGYFPPTPDSSSAHDSNPLESNHSSQTPTTGLPQGEEYSHKVNNAVGVAAAGTLGLVVGGPVGAVIAGGIVGLVESENDQLKAHEDELAHQSSTGTSSTVNEPEKAFDSQEQNSETALHESPAQKLVNSDSNEEGSNLTGAGALGGALLAGGAGAKVAENEVAEPLNEDHTLTPTATRRELPDQPNEPEFGTPAIEKEQAELAHSPAQRLLGERSESTVGAENILLAGGTGAAVADREIEEPEVEPKEEVATSSAHVPPTETASKPLERSVSSVPNPAPETPRPTATTQPSNSSFAAAVLAAGSGIDTPTREDVPLSMSGSTGVHPLVQASDESTNDTASIKTATPAETSAPKSTIHTHPNIFPVFPATQTNAPVVSEKEIAPEVSEPITAPPPAVEPKNEEVVHNPPPQTLDALAPTSGVVEPEADRPQDFQPYTPPVATEEEQEPVYQDKGKGKAKEVEMVAAGAGAGAGAAIIAHELREKRSIDSNDGRTSSQPGSIFQENFTPQPQPVEYNPLAIENQRAIPPQQAQGDPVLVMPTSSVDKGKGRAIDPEDLHKVTSTTPEQAGFAPGAPKTVATEEFAHLSEPAPQAEIEAQKEVPQNVAPLQAQPQAGSNEKSSAVPLVVPAVAGFAAGAAAPLAVNNNATSAHFSQAPPNSTLLAQQQQQPTVAQQPTPVVPQQQAPIVQQQQAPIAQQAPIVQQQQQQQQAQPSKVNAAVAPTQPQSQVQPQAQPQLQPTPQSRIVSPTQQHSPVGRSNSPHGLAEGVERSPHMHIQTHADEGGKKKLHRKSLQADTVPLKFGVGKTKASKPDKSLHNEARRERMMDGLSGVPDPTIQHQQPTSFSHVPPAQQQDAYYQRNPAVAQQQQPIVRQQQAQPGVQFQQQQQPFSATPQGAVAGPGSAQLVQASPHRLAAVAPQGNATPVPINPGAQVQMQPQSQGPVRTSAPSSPVSPVGQNNNETVHRKLSKSRPRRKSNASAGSEKGGFLGKVFGRHSRSTSGSVDGGSNRGSLEMQRPAPQ